MSCSIVASTFLLSLFDNRNDQKRKEEQERPELDKKHIEMLLMHCSGHVSHVQRVHQHTHEVFTNTVVY
jgi:hypothetical protein